MRRVVIFIVAVGLTIIWIGTSAVSRAGSGAAGARQAAQVTQVTRIAQVTPIAVPVKAVEFGGYTIDVPVTWPVYYLGSGSTVCVEYDRNAVYLGQPGLNQDCQARVIGRVATISLQVQPSAGQPGANGTAAGAGVSASFQAVGNLPQVGASVLDDSADHELYASVQSPGLSISATYGSDATSVLAIIQSVSKSSQAAGTAARSGTAQAGARAGARVGGGTGAVAGGATAAAPVRANSAGQVVGKGFDTCAAPSLAVMQAWIGSFSYAGIYIGGDEVGCGPGNLSASWVSSVTGLGWGLIPTYVGAQAPCNTQFTERINPAQAGAEGRSAAWDAVQHAIALGLGRGTPIYYDMESYNIGNASCAAAVLSFLNMWTRELHATGYVSGVYSSASTGARALGLASYLKGHPVAEPDALWFALWDGGANVIGTPYLSPYWWIGAQRIKQYLGGHNRKVNGFTVNIDSDLIHGPVYR